MKPTAHLSHITAIKMAKKQSIAPDFESIRQVNPEGQEFWSARDLSKMLGYTTWRHFDGAVKRAEISCEQAGQTASDHFVGGVKMVVLGSGSERRIPDYLLSRFACYLIAQNGDPRKPEIASAQAYFAVSTRQNELNQLSRRLEIREYLALSEINLAHAAQQAGVLPENFGKFQDAGYQGLYGGLTQAQIKQYKGVAAEEDLLDRMGEEELAANYFKSTQTRRKLHDENISSETGANETHHEVGEKIRETITELGGTMPEELPAEPSLKPLLEERQRSVKQIPSGNTNN
jgi:DNA-damage-inducible protein D